MWPRELWVRPLLASDVSGGRSPYRQGLIRLTESHSTDVHVRHTADDKAGDITFVTYDADDGAARYPPAPASPRPGRPDPCPAAAMAVARIGAARNGVSV